tara:strand:+ start:12773 stop:12991 length:219 start_codon:yes stop_codon:yes gene_type:complete
MSEKRTLTDGRSFWTTGNGFIFWVSDKKGVEAQVTEEYYKKVRHTYFKQKKKERKNPANRTASYISSTNQTK